MQRSVAVGREAALQKELLELQRDYQELKRKHDGTEVKCGELRGKLRDTKTLLGTRDRELEVSQKMLQRLGSERTQLQCASDDSKLYMRRLEAKVSELRDQADLGAKHAKATKQVASLQARLAAAEAELAACEDVNQERAREVTRLQQALEIRAEELSSKGGGDVQAQLLYSLAESREECLHLAKQLAEVKSEQTRVAAAAACLSDELAASQALRAEAEAAAFALHERYDCALAAQQQQDTSAADARVKRLKSELRSAKAAASTAAGERDALAAELAAAQNENEELVQYIEEEQRAHWHNLNSAQSKADATADELVHVRANLRSEVGQRSQREHMLEQRCVALAQRLEQVEGHVKGEEDRMAHEAASKQGRMLVLESQVAAGRERERMLQQQLASVQQQLGELEQTQAEAGHAITQQHQSQATMLEAQLRLMQAERDQLALRLKQQDNDTDAQVRALRQAAEGARATAAAREAGLAAARRELDELRSELAEARDTAAQLARAKEKLQQAMLKQISSVRIKLQQAEAQSQHQHQLLILATSPNAASSNGAHSFMQRGAAQRSMAAVRADIAAAAAVGRRRADSANAAAARQLRQRVSTSNSLPDASAGRAVSTGRGLHSAGRARSTGRQADARASWDVGAVRAVQRARAASAERLPSTGRGRVWANSHSQGDARGSPVEEQSDMFDNASQLGGESVESDAMSRGEAERMQQQQQPGRQRVQQQRIESQPTRQQQQHAPQQHAPQHQGQRQQGQQGKAQHKGATTGRSSPSGSSDDGHGVASWRPNEVYDASTGQLYDAVMRPQQATPAARPTDTRNGSNGLGANVHASGAQQLHSGGAAAANRQQGRASSPLSPTMQPARSAVQVQREQQMQMHDSALATSRPFNGALNSSSSYPVASSSDAAMAPPTARPLANERSMEEPYSLPASSARSTPCFLSRAASDANLALQTPKRREQHPPQPQVLTVQVEPHHIQYAERLQGQQQQFLQQQQQQQSQHQQQQQGQQHQQSHQQQQQQPASQAAEAPAGARLAAARETLQRLRSGRLGGALDAQASSASLLLSQASTSSLHRAAAANAASPRGPNSPRARPLWLPQGQAVADGLMSPPSTGRGPIDHQPAGRISMHMQPVPMKPLADEASSRSLMSADMHRPSAQQSRVQLSRQVSAVAKPGQLLQQHSVKLSHQQSISHARLSLQPSTAKLPAQASGAQELGLSKQASSARLAAHAPQLAAAGTATFSTQVSSAAWHSRAGSGGMGQNALEPDLLQLLSDGVPSLEELANLEGLLG